DVSIDPGARSTDSQFDPGLLDLSAEVRLAGWGLTRRVGVEDGQALAGAALDHPRHWLWPYRTTDGHLSFSLQKRPPRAGGISGSVTLTAGAHHLPSGLEASVRGVARLPQDVTMALTSGSRRLELPV